LYDLGGNVIKDFKEVLAVQVPKDLRPLGPRSHLERHQDPFDYFLRDGILVDIEGGTGVIDPLTWTLLRDETQCCAGDGLLAEREGEGKPWRFRAMRDSSVVPPGEFAEVTKFSLGLAAIRIEGHSTWSVIDRWGNVTAKGLEFKEILGVSGGTLVAAIEGGRQGVFDLQLGDWVHEPVYTTVVPYFVDHYNTEARLDKLPWLVYLGRGGEVSVPMECSELLPRCAGVTSPLCDPPNRTN
jgi:hypothetical protein